MVEIEILEVIHMFPKKLMLELSETILSLVITFYHVLSQQLWHIELIPNKEDKIQL